MNGETENGRTETADVRKGNFEGKILDATNLKLLAAVLMLLDHIHQMFSAVGAPLWLTMAGRPVFPLFLFAASESFIIPAARGNICSGFWPQAGE